MRAPTHVLTGADREARAQLLALDEARAKRPEKTAQIDPQPVEATAGDGVSENTTQQVGKPWADPAEPVSSEITPEDIDGMTKAELAEILSAHGIEVNPDSKKANELKEMVKNTIFTNL